jgi:hypothetical protein
MGFYGATYAHVNILMVLNQVHEGSTTSKWVLY